MRAPFSFWPGPFKPHRVRGAVLTIRNDLCVQASRPAVACVDLKARNRPVVDQPLQRFHHVVPRLLARGFGGLGALQQPRASVEPSGITSSGRAWRSVNRLIITAICKSLTSALSGDQSPAPDSA